MVGIPRALLYYHYHPLWRKFFEALGLRVVVSGETTKELLDAAVRVAVDEVCLPVKLFFGHALDLRNRVDYLFVPRLVRVEPRAYICPKFMGLPDMVAQTIDGLPSLLKPRVDMARGERGLLQAAFEVGRALGRDGRDIRPAHVASVRELAAYWRKMGEGTAPLVIPGARRRGGAASPDLTRGWTVRLGVAGHPYNLYDRYASLDILRHSQEMGADCVTPEMVGNRTVERYAATLRKELFWTLGKRVLGASLYWIDSGQVDGIVHVAAFACGLDSVVGELLERAARRRGVPFTRLILDEHTAETGVVTRLEAFVDMVRRRRGKACE